MQPQNIPRRALDLIGNTPLVELPQLSPKPGVRIFAKLEGQNPSGSIKDRIVLGMIEAAERRGDLEPGDTIVEASSGNTAIALAMIGRQKGYQVRVCIPENVAPSISDVLDLYGVQVGWTRAEAGMEGAIQESRRAAEQDGFYALGQFTDIENMETHYRTTGLEIVQALPRVDLFVAGIGTAGTIMGVGRRLREASPNVKIVGVEPRPGDRVQGLRNIEAEGFVPPLLDLAQLDGRFLVDSATAIQMAHRIVRMEGIQAGISAGAALHAALRAARDLDEGNVVVMFSDGGWKYLPARPWNAAREGSRLLDETHWW
jgi:cysteine synthase B